MNSVWNMIVAVSSLAAYMPLKMCIDQEDYVTGKCVLLTAFLSFIAYAFQSHKHQMVGFGAPRRLSKFLNMLDITGAVPLTVRIVWLFYRSNFKMEMWDRLYQQLFLTVILKLLSEYAFSDSRLFYVAFHSLWNIHTFVLLSYFLFLRYYVWFGL